MVSSNKSTADRGVRMGFGRVAKIAFALLVAAPMFAIAATPSTTLERIRNAGQIKLGYYADARPFSFRDPAGKPQGYSIALCERIAEAIKSEVALDTLKVQWIATAPAERARALQDGRADLMCGEDRETLAARQDMSFSIAIFPGGIGAVVRADAPVRLREILLGQPSNRPSWRASAGQLIQAQTFAVVRGSSAESRVRARLNEFNLTAKVISVASYAEGVERMLAGQANVLFGDRAILRAVIDRSGSARELSILDHFFTHESIALGLPRDDDALRLVVDSTLSRLYRSEEFKALYGQWFEAPGSEVLTFFIWTARPE